MSEAGRLGRIVERERLNAAIAWVVIAFLLGVVIASLVNGDVLWAGFAVVVATLALIPMAAYRRPSLMLPWEVLMIAALPLIGRTFATVPLTSQLATYLAVAALALIIAVELHLFTTVLMTPGFAVLFVVVATMATAGVWAVVRWVLDVVIGTQFLLVAGVEEDVIERQLMWEFVYSTMAGIAAGVIFEGYFRRRARYEDRIPEGVEVTKP